MHFRLAALLVSSTPVFGQYFTQEVVAPDGQPGDRFGTRVSIDGGWMACSAPEASVGNFADAGAVYLYHRRGTVWEFHSKLISPNPETGGAFGFSHDLKDWEFGYVPTLAVGAKFEDAAGTDSGAVYVYRYEWSTDEWSLYATPIPIGLDPFDAYGQEVALDAFGEYLAIGSIRDDDRGLDAGAVYVMDAGGSSIQKYFGSDTEAGDSFGVSIDFYDTHRMVVGAVYEDSAGSSAGAAYLWTGTFLPGSSTSEVFRLSAPDGSANDFFGISVAMNAQSVAVGAEGDDDFGAESGSVYVWQYAGSGVLSPSNLTKQYSPSPAAFDTFGNQLASSDASTWAASVRGGDTCTQEGGSVFFSNVGNPWPGVGGQLVCSPSPTRFDGFSTGIDLDFHGNWLVAGSPNNDSQGQGAGSVAIWNKHWRDCDNNGMHDYREMVLDPSLDCDLSGTLDSCQISAGLADCNTNGVLDTCDLSAGTSSDHDGNGVPDECERVGMVYCDPAAPNTTGEYGKIFGLGSNVVIENDLILIVEDLPTNQFGYFLTGQNQGYIPFPGGSDGILCLSGNLGRFNRPGEVWNSSTAGSAAMGIDLTDTPINVGGVVVSGQTWQYQAWHRDNMTGVSRSNFTTALQVIFQ